MRILNDGFAPTGADHHQSCCAIVEHAGQNHANHPAAIGGSRGTKQRIDGRAVQIFARPLQHS